MLFQTPEFGLLLLLTLAAFYGLPQRFRLTVLVLASLSFYAASGLLHFVLLLAMLGITYRLSSLIRPGRSKWPLAASLLLPLATLTFFKYSEFLYMNAGVLTTKLGLPELPHMGGYLLPLGISFYTFQVMAYLFDLDRGRTQPAPTFKHYLVFIMFFGQLIAGPIMRASGYIDQFVHLRGAKANDFRIGALMVLSGLVKKVVIADFLATRVDALFASAATLSQPDVWIAAYLFAFQIYFDFSGYTDIALGLGRMLGINLQQNFLTPYLSRNPREFWRRWHITLSSWFRDYVYIPLGGNRKGRVREIVGVMAVMSIVGLWHGAGWTFVVWGAFHGVLLGVSRFVPTETLRALVPVPKQYRTRVYGGLAVFVFFHLTVLAWIPFRAPDLATAYHMLLHALQFSSLGLWVDRAPILIAVGALFGLHITERLVREHAATSAKILYSVPSVVRGMGYAAVVLVIVARSVTEQSFIYFRF